MIQLLIVLLGTALADEGPPPVCDPDTEVVDGDHLLRALSLDLRGVVPTAEDHEALVDGEVPDELLDAWLDDEGFVERVVRHHEALLWPNVGDIRLLSNRQRMISKNGVLYRYLVAPNYRGGPEYCGDFEASWDGQGELVTRTTPEGWIQEGWVEVHPYWAPDTTVKVCAFEAQTAEVSPWGTECDTYDSRYDPYCGCGPGLQWCDTPALGHVQEEGYVAPVHRAIAEDVRRRIARVIRGDLSYLELFTSPVAYVNGPLAHFYRHNTRTPAHVRFNEMPVDPDLLPDLDFTDEDTWVEVSLGEEQAGVLTSPLYLMKFQTRRARANRFYTAFLCQPFQPPDGGIPGLDEADPTLDLTQRKGCQYCHAILEPAGAHWGRWGEYGAGYLPASRYPTTAPECQWCAQTGESCSAACRQYYVVDPLTQEQDPYVGMLQGYQFLEERHRSHPEVGPKLLATQGVVDGRLPRCVARTTATWLLGREPATHEEAWVDALARTFTEADYRYDALVRAIVTSDNYRRVR
ncbi:MAG: DUF1585 domain-containing protein [Alphaproteobacteria bacterium]|nr:DUF1585 domain-containing protein [Alphaproteobacteria bacterium]